MNEKLLKKFGVKDFDNIKKDEEGNFDQESAIRAIFEHAQRMALEDSNNTKAIKEQGVKEGKAEMQKKAIKAFANKFGLEVTNSEAEELSFDDVATKAFESISDKKKAEVNSSQEELIKIANEKKALEEEYKSKLEAVKKDFEDKENERRARKALRKRLRGDEDNRIEYIVEDDVAMSLFYSQLQKDGLDIRIDETGAEKIYSGENLALKEDKTSFLTIENLRDKYLGKIVKKSNGSPDPVGGGNMLDKFKDPNVKVNSRLQEMLQQQKNK